MKDRHRTQSEFSTGTKNGNGRQKNVGNNKLKKNSKNKNKNIKNDSNTQQDQQEQEQLQLSKNERIEREILYLEDRIKNETPKRSNTSQKKNIFNDISKDRIAFRALPISENTLKGLESSSTSTSSNDNSNTKGYNVLNGNKSYSTMTSIQTACIPYGLAGRDIIGCAQTGSGKTLTYLIPLLEILYRNRYSSIVSSSSNTNDNTILYNTGVGGIVLVPTRELAVQIFYILKSIGRYHTISIGLLIGGSKDFYSEQQVINNTTILLATPGRLVQHLEQTSTFDISNIHCLIIDEADRMLDLGFRRQLITIFNYLPDNTTDTEDSEDDTISNSTRRQTMLFSATLSNNVQSLISVLKLQNPEYITVHESNTSSTGTSNTNNTNNTVTDTPILLRQSYVIVPMEHKLNAIYSFIKTHLHCKILLFCNTCSQVRYIYELFKSLRPGITILALHGKLSQERRTQVYMDYIRRTSSSSTTSDDTNTNNNNNNNKNYRPNNNNNYNRNNRYNNNNSNTNTNTLGTALFATDLAARGLDFPNIDWVIQIDAPEDRDTYIHRVGRTARYRSIGKALLFVTPIEEQKGYIQNVLLQTNNNDNNNSDNKTTTTVLPISKAHINPTKATIVTDRAASVVAANPKFNELAKKAFFSYIRCIHLMPNKTIFSINDIDLEKYSTSLGLASIPHSVTTLIKKLMKEKYSTSTSTKSSDDTREEHREKKNVNKKLQRLKEQIKAEKLAKKLAKLGSNQQEQQEASKKSRDNDNDHDDSSDDDDDDDLLVPKVQPSTTNNNNDVNEKVGDIDKNNTMDEELNMDIELNNNKKKTKIGKIRIDGSNSTTNKHIIFNDDGIGEDKYKRIITSSTNKSNSSDDLNIIDTSTGKRIETIHKASTNYMDQIKQRLQTTKEQDTMEHKERLRLKKRIKRQREQNDTDTNNNDTTTTSMEQQPRLTTGAILKTSSNSSASSSSSSSSDDDDDSDGNESMSSNGNINGSGKNIKQQLRKRQKLSNEDSDSDSDSDDDFDGNRNDHQHYSKSSSLPDDDSTQTDNNNDDDDDEEIDLITQEEAALRLIRGG